MLLVDFLYQRAYLQFHFPQNCFRNGTFVSDLQNSGKKLLLILYCRTLHQVSLAYSFGKPCSLAETPVQTLKACMKKIPQELLEDYVNSFLFKYHTTPQTKTGVTPGVTSCVPSSLFSMHFSYFFFERMKGYRPEFVVFKFPSS